jgi:uncharacterized LabA/DUF88 family protein
LRVAVLIDGGHLRVMVRKNKTKYNPSYIEKVARACVERGESLLRILYYDCAPYEGTVKLPVSGIDHTFSGNDGWLKNLAAKDYFAVRRGVLKFRGYKPKKIPIASATLKDEDFKPDFEQKGVDMRIGLDMATYSESKRVDRLILITADTDCIPAMKHCRKEGLQVVLVSLQNQHLPPELLWHADFERRIAYPSP